MCDKNRLGQATGYFREPQVRRVKNRLRFNKHLTRRYKHQREDATHPENTTHDLDFHLSFLSISTQIKTMMKDRGLSKFALGKKDGQSSICHMLKVLLLLVIFEINLSDMQDSHCFWRSNQHICYCSLCR